jgi:hypothetical protein
LVYKLQTFTAKKYKNISLYDINNMNYLLISDIMWYFGHALTGISILFTPTNYYLAVSMVFFGQMTTILSRPIGRLHTQEDKDPNNELEECVTT